MVCAKKIDEIQGHVRMPDHERSWIYPEKIAYQSGTAYQDRIVFQNNTIGTIEINDHCFGPKVCKDLNSPFGDFLFLV